MAAAFSLSGSILGFIVPLSAAIRFSVSLADMAIWGLIAMVVQIAAFVVGAHAHSHDHRRHRRRQGRPGLLPRLALAGRGPAQRRLHELLSWRTQPRIFCEDLRLGPGRAVLARPRRGQPRRRRRCG